MYNTVRLVFTDNDVCNTVIKIGVSDHAARLSFRYNPTTGPHFCNITIETLQGDQTDNSYYRIAYTFLDTGVENNFKCSSKIYYNDGYSSGELCGSNVYPSTKKLTRDNRLNLAVVGDQKASFVFEVLLLSFHNGSCGKYETLCPALLGDSNIGSGCIEYSLVCNTRYTFCDVTGSQCSDIGSSTGSNNTIIAATVVSVLGVILLGLTCFLCYKYKFFGLLKRNESEESVRARAMQVFSVQFANRGVDGNDNTAATDDDGNPIDFSNFDPPPEYGSLEHLDTVGVSETDGNREDSGDTSPPPKYDEVMTNFDSYTVITPI